MDRLSIDQRAAISKEVETGASAWSAGAQTSRYLAGLDRAPTLITLHPDPEAKTTLSEHTFRQADMVSSTVQETAEALPETTREPAPDTEPGTEQAAESRYADTLPDRARRTEAAAGETTALVGNIAIITDRLYRRALTPIRNGTAFIMPVGIADSLGIGGGLPDISELAFSLENCSPEDIGKLDFGLLTTVYSIILNQLNQKVKSAQCPGEVLRILDDPNFEYVVHLFLPTFLEKIGAKPDADENRFAIARDKLKSFKDVVGIHVTKSKWGMQYKRYEVMTWISDDTETNTVRFSSPYCNYIARLLLKKHLKTDKRGNLEMPPGGPPAMTVSHSYALRTIWASERNKLAVEIVVYVAYLIETTGRSGGIPHASARKIVEECPRLLNRIANAKSTSDKNKYLKRAFERAWKILGDPKYSDLAEKHEDLLVPTEIPKMQTLDKIVYQFSTRAGKPKAAKTANATNRKKDTENVAQSALPLPRTVL